MMPEDEEEAGIEALIQELEPYAEKARQSIYGLLHISGARFAVIVRAHCSYTEHHGQRLSVADFELMKGYEDVDFSTAIKHLLNLRAEEDSQ